MTASMQSDPHLGEAFARLAGAVGVEITSADAVEVVLTTMERAARDAAVGQLADEVAEHVGAAARAAGAIDAFDASSVTVMLDVGIRIRHLYSARAHGSIDDEAFVRSLGAEALTVAAVYVCGGIGTALCPVPVVGALAGKVVGRTLAQLILESGILERDLLHVAAARDRRLATEGEARAVMRRCDQQLHELADLAARDERGVSEVVEPALRVLDAPTFEVSVQDRIEALVALNAGLRRTLHLASFDDFDAFMRDDEELLVL